MSKIAGYADELENPSFIACKFCVDQYDVSSLEEITDDKAKEYGDKCDLCGEYLAEGEPRPVPLPLHRTEAGYPRCATCDGGGCFDCTEPA